jgi:ABC-type dipeptide/oligopeptide/nickel transport system permease subunit
MMIGLISGFKGGNIDNTIMTVVNMILSLPYLVFVVFVAAILGNSLINVILIFGFTDIPIFVRVTRGEVLRLREQGFVESARSIGMKTPRIIFKHIMPNLIGPLITLATFEMSAMIFYEAGLGFLGLSVPPTIPSWGNMLAMGRQYLTIYPWMSVYPGLAIVFTGFGMNLLGDWLRDVMDPRSRRMKK